MLAHQTQKSLSNAREYVSEHLQAGDYYSAGQRVAGQCFGAGAEQLGLTGHTKEEEFLRLCDNQHPVTGEKLTVRMKKGSRRIFEDFVFSPPKSVSLAALLPGDHRVISAHQAAVPEALHELERLAGCRVRKGGVADADRPTGNIAAVRFDHETSRLLDPQLHTHCIVFNATCDEAKGRWKALQNHAILREVYRNRLAAELYRLGYDLDQTENSFEIRGIPAGVCERFSKRREQIDDISTEIAASKNGANIHEIRDHVVHRVRDRKIMELGRDELVARWEEQLSVNEKAALASLRRNTSANQPDQSEEALAWSIEHVFERKSVVREKELFAEALAHGRGRLDLKEHKKLSDKQGFLRMPNGDLTTRAMLEKEWDVMLGAQWQGRQRPAQS